MGNGQGPQAQRRKPLPTPEPQSLFPLGLKGFPSQDNLIGLIPRELRRLIAFYQTPVKAQRKVSYKFLTRFTTKNGKDYSEGPEGIVVAPDSKHIFVANTHYGEILVFDYEGELIRILGKPGFGDGELFMPVALQFDFYGNLVVLDKGNYRLQVFDQKGQFQYKIGLGIDSSGPSDFSIDNEGNFVIPEYFGCKVKIFHGTSGTLLKTFGEKGSEPGQLLHPQAVAVSPCGDIIIGDTENHRVQIFSSTGELIKIIAEGRRPTGLVVDTQGNIFLSDTVTELVCMYSKKGDFVSSIGSGLRRTNLGQVHEGAMGCPNHLTLDNSGNLLVTDAGPYSWIHIFG